MTPATIGLIFTLTIAMISWFQDGIKFTAEIEIDVSAHVLLSVRCFELTSLWVCSDDVIVCACSDDVDGARAGVQEAG